MTNHKKSVVGKPWSTHSKHNVYELARATKESLTNDENLQVKIRRYADETFHVKTRVIVPDQETKSPQSKRVKKEKPKTRSQRRAEKMRRKSQQEKKL